MDVKIKYNEREVKDTTPRYRVDISYMWNDADGYHEHEIIIPKKQLNDYKHFLFSLEACNSAYPRGQGGDDNCKSLFEYNLYYDNEVELYDFHEEMGINEDELNLLSEQDQYDFLNKRFVEIKNKLNPKKISLDFPTYEEFYYSFDGYTVTYIDENGDEYPCELSFTDEEKARFNEISETLKY